jgi:hypothetical protein
MRRKKYILDNNGLHINKNFLFKTRNRKKYILTNEGLKLNRETKNNNYLFQTKTKEQEETNNNNYIFEMKEKEEQEEKKNKLPTPPYYPMPSPLFKSTPSSQKTFGKNSFTRKRNFRLSDDQRRTKIQHIEEQKRKKKENKLTSYVLEESDKPKLLLSFSALEYLNNPDVEDEDKKNFLRILIKNKEKLREAKQSEIIKIQEQKKHFINSQNHSVKFYLQNREKSNLSHLNIHTHSTQSYKSGLSDFNEDLMESVIEKIDMYDRQISKLSVLIESYNYTLKILNEKLTKLDDIYIITEEEENKDEEESEFEEEEMHYETPENSDAEEELEKQYESDESTNSDKEEEMNPDEKLAEELQFSSKIIRFASKLFKDVMMTNDFEVI